MDAERHLEQQRQELAYRRLYDDVLNILRRHDPLGIGSSLRPNEYVPEVGTILPRLAAARSAADVRDAVHDEFRRWRGEAAGESAAYDVIAREVWEARTRHRP